MRRVLAILGVAGLVVIVGGVVRAAAGLAHYSPWRNFISELGGPWNPAAANLNRGFIIGAALVVACLAGVAIRERGLLRRAAGCGAASATGLFAVGVYPIHRGVPHVAAALIAIAFTVAASVHLAVAARRHMEGAGRFAAASITAIVIVQCADIVAAVVYATHRVATTSLEVSRIFYSQAIQVENPFVRESLINPIAISEWLLLATALALLGAVLFRELVNARAGSG